MNWSAINNSDLKWESIKKLKNSSPYIFIRNIDTKKHHWTFIGKGELHLYNMVSSPVKFKWKIIKSKTNVVKIEESEETKK